MRDAHLGSATIRGPRSVAAGSYVTFELVYTAGAAGVDDRGSVCIAFRDMCDAGALQWTDPKAPNYITARTDADARLVFQDRGDIRPWREGITVKVVDGFLPPGGKIVITFGDTSGGSPGWQVQTFCEETFEFRVLANPFSTKVHERLPASPEVRIAPDVPVKVEAVAPTIVAVGERFEVRVRKVDRWGNPTRRARTIRHKGFAEPGVYRLPVDDAKTAFTCETNPIVVTERVDLGRYWADFHAQSEETIGTNSVEAYFAFARDKAFLDVASHQGNDIQITDTFWKRLNHATRDFNAPGRFVTFPGYEWSGNTGVGGDHNVIYRNEGNPIARSSRALVPEGEASQPDAPTATALFDELRKRDAIVFAHVGGRYANLDMHDDVEVAVEIHSCWGTQEWLLADALSRGYRVGIVANSDGHKGRPGAEYPGASHFGNRGGLTCILARKLTRDAVWEAMKARHFYATTGARIFLDVRTDSGAMMGDVVCADEASMLHVHVAGTAPIERVEVRNGMKVVKTFRPYGARNLGRRVKVLWEGSAHRGRERDATWDGELTVSGNRIVDFQPVNFDNPTHSCERAGARGLRWHSVTTGGCAGVIVELAEANRGTLAIRTAQKNMTVALKSLGLAGRTSRVRGGVDLALHACPLPDANDVREMTFDYVVGGLDCGDNPLYVHAVQEDGQRAWSSPIYIAG